MTEHGVLKRVLLAYRAASAQLAAGRTPPAGAVLDAAQIIADYVESFHEGLEEAYVFPRVRRDDRYADLVTTLLTQHDRGRHLTAAITVAAGANLRDPAVRTALRRYLDRFVSHVRTARSVGGHRHLPCPARRDAPNAPWTSWPNASPSTRAPATTATRWPSSSTASPASNSNSASTTWPRSRHRRCADAVTTHRSTLPAPARHRRRRHRRRVHGARGAVRRRRARRVRGHVRHRGAGVGARRAGQLGSPRRGHLSAAPAQVSVTFDEAVGLRPGYLRVIDGTGRRVDSGAAFHPAGHDDVVAVRLRGGLGKAAYVASYRVISADSHPVSGAVQFTVGGAAPVAARPAGNTTDRLVSVLFDAARSVTFLGLALFGGAWLVLVMRAATPRRGPGRPGRARPGSLVAQRVGRRDPGRRRARGRVPAPRPVCSRRARDRRSSIPPCCVTRRPRRSVDGTSSRSRSWWRWPSRRFECRADGRAGQQHRALDRRPVGRATPARRPARGWPGSPF